MACRSFDVGVLRLDGHILLREGWAAEQIGNALSWLRRENAYGAHIYIRPSGAHALSLVDDLSADSLKRMKESGFEPTVTVETSPGNFQAWLNHGRVLTCALSTQAAKELARRFGGDPSSADWRHFGRLAGLTNQKPGRRLPTGLPPFVQLRQSRGVVYTAAAEFLGQVIALAERSRLRTAASAQRQTHSHEELHREVRDFHHDPRYAGISIARIWRGPYMRQAAVFQSNRLETRSSMPAISPKKAGLPGSSTTPKGRPPKPSLPAGRRTDPSLARLRYGQRGEKDRRTAQECLPFPLRRAQCGAPAAEPASAPALRAASLCHARTVRRRRIPAISRNPSDLGEGVAPQNGAVGQ